MWGRESADVFSSLVSAAEEPKFRNRSSPWQRAAARVRRERESGESSQVRVTRRNCGQRSRKKCRRCESRLTSQPFRGRTPYSQKDIHTGQRKGAACRGGHRKICDARSRGSVYPCTCVCVCKQRNAKSGKTLHQLEREDRALCIRDCLPVFACLPAFFRHFLPMN